MSKEMQKSI